MGINVRMYWKGQTEEEKKERDVDWSKCRGHVGMLREGYYGEPYAIKILFQEIFRMLEGNLFRIPKGIEWKTVSWRSSFGEKELIHEPAFTYSVKLLGRRLPKAISATKERHVNIHGNVLSDDNPIVRSFVDFVKLAGRKEKQTGEPIFVTVCT